MLQDTSEIKNPPNKNQRMLPKYFIMTIKLSYSKISLAIAFTLSTSIGLRVIYTFFNDFYECSIIQKG